MKEQCFETVGYSDWCENIRENTKQGSKAAMVESTSITDSSSKVADIANLGKASS